MGRLNRVCPGVFAVLIAREHKAEQNPAGNRVVVAVGFLLERCPQVTEVDLVPRFHFVFYEFCQCCNTLGLFITAVLCVNNLPDRSEVENTGKLQSV